MPDAPDLTANIVAQRTGGVWTFQAMPNGVGAEAERLTLGSGPMGAGMMFPLGLLDQFVVGWTGNAGQ